MTKPNPNAYCAVHHGGALFPDLLLQLVRAGPALPDQYAFLAVLKQQCCIGCGLAQIACDPTICHHHFVNGIAAALATDHPVARFAASARDRYRRYYDQEVLGLGRYGIAKPSGAIDDALRELFGEQ